MNGEPGAIETAAIATQETNKKVLELPPEEQKVVVEKALGVLNDEKVREDLENRGEVIASLDVLKQVLAFKAENVEKIRQSMPAPEAIDPAKRDEAVKAIVESEGFDDIAAKGRAFREARKVRAAQNPAQQVEISVAESSAEQVAMDIVEAWNVMKDVGDPFEVSLDAEVNANRDRAMDVATKVAREFVGITAPKELLSVPQVELMIEKDISQTEVQAAVEEVTDTEFFRDLLAKTQKLKAERAAKQNLG